MVDEMSLVCCELDLHIEFTPALFLDTKWRILEGCI